jgi:pyridoxamine 5'-phosphate oxidase
MNFEECVKFANENPVAYFATTEGDQPHVRAFLMWFADKTGFYFEIGAMKATYGQLKANPKTEFCFYDNKNPNGTMMRVTGKVEFLNDIALKTKVIADRPFLKAFGFTPEHPDLIVFRITKGEACFWTMQTNFEPKKLIKFG